MQTFSFLSHTSFNSMYFPGGVAEWLRRSVSYLGRWVGSNPKVDTKNHKPAANSGPVYTIPFSCHIGSRMAIRYKIFYCLHDIIFHFTSDWGSVYMRKRYESYRNCAFSYKQETNPI